MTSEKTSPLKTCDIASTEFHSSGPQWGEASEDLNVTLLSWEQGKGVPSHVNAELDVCIVVIAGKGQALIGDKKLELHPGLALVIPKGSERSITSQSEQLTYYSIHRRRPGLMPKFAEKS